MPEPGRVTDPDVRESQLVLGTLETINKEEILFINSMGLNEGDPVLFERKLLVYNNGKYKLKKDKKENKIDGPNFEISLAVLPEEYDELIKINGKMKWKDPILHKEWKKNGTNFLKLGIQNWADYSNYDPNQG